jgi:hypothetical protein
MGGVQDVVPEDFVSSSSSRGLGCGLIEHKQQVLMMELTKGD